jgi:peroxiredoxin
MCMIPRMPTAAQPDLLNVDWSKIPVPNDDGAAQHLLGMQVADVNMDATDGSSVSLATLQGRTVLFAYPRTGVPGEPALAEDWDMIPGARGCTPQSCAFRDLYAELRAAGAAYVFGLSTQDTHYQKEAAVRLHLPFPLLSDAGLRLTRSMRLPTMDVAGQVLLKRFALLLHDGCVERVWYPVFPPDRNAQDVLAELIVVRAVASVR